MCDASDFSVGAALGQQRDNKPFVIYYASKTLDEAQLLHHGEGNISGGLCR